MNKLNVIKEYAKLYVLGITSPSICNNFNPVFDKYRKHVEQRGKKKERNVQKTTINLKGESEMREIKFKAYIRSLDITKEVIEINFDRKVVEVDFSNGEADLVEYTFDEVDLLQYTGLKDEKGVEIYEGDEVMLLGEKAIVKFEYGQFIAKDSEGMSMPLYSIAMIDYTEE